MVRHERRPHRMVVQHVTVAPPDRRETGVEIRRHGDCPLDRHGIWKMGVHAPNPRALGTLRLGLEVNDLGRCVHACVGASGRGNAQRVSGDRRDRALEMILDAFARGLRLPAAETAAVVSDAEGDFHERVDCLAMNAANGTLRRFAGINRAAPAADAGGENENGEPRSPFRVRRSREATAWPRASSWPAAAALRRLPS